MDYKVFIPSAGLGSRLGKSYSNLNKALVSINNKPVISHLIEKFDSKIELVIALGYKGKLLKEYLEIAHPERLIQFVEIDNFCGIGSGLGHTILKCKKYLQSPFLFCPNDTYIIEEIPKPDINWAGYSDLENNKNYRSFKIDSNNCVQELIEKDEISVKNTKPYIGLAGIKDYQFFWEEMEKGKNYGSINIGESYAIKNLIQQNYEFIAKKFTWFDTGNLETLKNAREILKKENAPQILEKQDEAIWFVNKKVIKYSKKEEFISKRVKRSKILYDFVPEIDKFSRNMYSYKEVAGQVFSRISNKKTFAKLLDFLEKFWEKKNLNKAENKKFKESCLNFYRNKTINRIDLYFSRYSEQDNIEIINGFKAPKIKDLLDNIDWNYLSDGLPTRFHGDLHFENILVTETGEFFLLDWREDFGGLDNFGDIYYDLAKILHGIIISHKIINDGSFSIEKEENIIKFDFQRMQKLVEYENEFLKYLENKSLDIFKVKLITALIFLNIAPLHHDPYSRLLFYLGKEQLLKLNSKFKF